MNNKVGLKRILIIDDDLEFRKLLKSLLSEYFQDVEFHEFDPVKEGEPSDSFDWSMFDVLILDYYLCVHGLNGLDLFQKHHKKTNFPPTIMLTGAGNEELAIRALKSGIKDYVRKDSLNTAMLAEAITSAYEEYRVKRNAQDELQATNKQIQKERAERSTEVAALKAQLEILEEEKQTYQDAADDVQRIKSEAEEQFQKERSELSTEIAAMKAQLEILEDEKKRIQQETIDEVQQMKNEAKELISREYSALTKRTTVLRMQSQKIEKRKEKIYKAIEKLSLEKENILAERRNHAEEMAKVKKELENAKRELAAGKTKRKTAKEEKYGKLVKLQDEKVANKKTIKSDQFDEAIDPDELLDPTMVLHIQKENVIEEKTEVIETNEKAISSDLSDKSIDPDELLDPTMVLHIQKENVIEEKTEVIETNEKAISSDLSGESIDPDELLDPNGELHIQKENVIEEKTEVIETNEKAISSDLSDKTIDADELLDPSRKSNKQKNGSGQDEDS